MWLGHEGALINEIDALRKGTSESSLAYLLPCDDTIRTLPSGRQL